MSDVKKLTFVAIGLVFLAFTLLGIWMVSKKDTSQTPKLSPDTVRIYKK